MSETVESVPVDAKAEVKKSPVKTDSNDQKDSDAAAKNGHLSPEELSKRILRQVEYYFGDFNMARDKFLSEQVKADDGWVPMEVMLKFKRLAGLSEDTSVIAAALKTSSLVELSEDGARMRRSPDHPLPPVGDDWKQSLVQRTLYFKGLPADTNLDAALSFFGELGHCENVQMRNWHDKKTAQWCFKGSAYATFKSREEAERIIQNAPVKYNDNELIVQWQSEHIEEKQAERGAKKKNENSDKNGSEDVEKADRDKEADKEADKEPEKDEAPKYFLGTVVHMKGFKEEVTWPQVKDALNVFQVGRVAYVDFSTGDVEGYARFFEEGAAQRVFDKLEVAGQLKVGDNTVEIRVLEGEEETKYMDAQMEARAKRPPGKKRKYHTGVRGRGGPAFKRGRA